MTTETAITDDLQRRVADALGLPRTWKSETSHGVNPSGSAIWHFEDFTTGDGMLRLVEAMRWRDYGFTISAKPHSRWQCIAVKENDAGGIDMGSEHAPTLPAAVLRAAALALGVTAE